MSSPDVFLSSPRVARRTLRDSRASSPDLPDVQDLVQSRKPKRPPLKSGSKAVPIPENVLTGFTTARGLWQTVQAAEGPSSSILHTADPIYLSGEDDSVCVVQAPPQPAKKAIRPRRPRQQKAAKGELSPVTQSLPVDAHSPETPSKSQPWRKYRPSPKGHTSSPADATRGFDAPPSAQVPVDEPRFLKTDSVSKHFQSQRPDRNDEQKVGPAASEPVVMDPAPLRRLDWTPPAKALALGTGGGDHDSDERTPDSPGDGCQVEFKNLLRDFSCPETTTKATELEAEEATGGFGKRKLIEPVLVREQSASERSRSRSPIKKKLPKKPRTITELATAAYRKEEELEPPPASLLNYLSVNPEGDGPDKQSKGKAKGKGKPRKKTAATTSKRKAASTKATLLSPGAALKHVANQDFVFGTSSQLAQEKSPTFLRSLHAAMRQSNEIDEGDLAIPLNSDAIEPSEPKSKLWDAAARDNDGDLFDVEVIDLVDASPTLPHIGEEADPFGYVHDDEAGTIAGAKKQGEVKDSLLSLTDILTEEPSKSSKPSAPHATSRSITPIPLPKTSAKTSLSLGEDSSQIIAQDDDPGPELPILTELPQSPPLRPAYETFTDAQLAKQISKFGFKPLKRRATMIALLDNCWKSQLASGRATGMPPKRTIATSAAKSPARPRGRPKKTVTDPAITLQASETVQVKTPPKKPRGRPRKDAGSPSKAAAPRTKKKALSPARKEKAKAEAQPAHTVTKTVLEIPDSESDQDSIRLASRSASPEAMCSSPPATANLSIMMDDDTDMSLTMTPTEQQATLFEYIRKAVLSSPRSNDVENPSWYEKMLLYDPIIVEDLAVWLNSGQLTNVGYDGEVNPAEVKKWCESMSVCCLWRDTHRGKERKRY